MIQLRTGIFLSSFFFLFQITFCFSSPPPDSLPSGTKDTILFEKQIHHYLKGHGAFYYLPFGGMNGSVFRNGYFNEVADVIFSPGISSRSIYEINWKQLSDDGLRIHYSQINYYLGSKKEQDFQIDHQQPVLKSLSAGLLFRTMNTSGYYANQAASQRNFRIYAEYHPPAAKFRLITGYLSNRTEAGENGGLKNESFFESASSGDVKFAEVNLTGAKSRHNNKGLFLQQKIFLRGTESIKSDSVIAEKPKLFLTHSSQAGIRKFRFIADKFYNEYFENAYYDTSATSDSLEWRYWNNEIGLFAEDLPWLNSALRANTTLYLKESNELFGYRQFDFDSSGWSHSISPGLMIRHEKFSADANYKISITDDSDVFHRIVLSGKKPVSEKVFLDFHLSYRTSLPPLIYSYYNSNHFIWRNNFGKVKQLHASAKGESALKNQHIAAALKIYSMEGYLYFNEFALPQQNNGRINIAETELHHLIRFGKFGLENSMAFRFAAPDRIIRLPKIAWYGSVFYANDFFNRNLRSKFGFDLRWADKYKADEFMPATGQFYLQNENKIGAYLYADIFADFKIKSASFFFKIEHANAGLMKRNYFLIPAYPMPGRTIKLGIVWRFFD